jgi:hypothetical protein
LKPQTHTPVKYEDLAPEQVAEIVNGCGGKGGKVVPPYAAMYAADCGHHDYGYWKGGSWWDRLKCDCKFWWAMQKDAFAFKWKIHKAVYFSGWAVLYFAGVRIGGWKYFHYGRKRYPAVNFN